MSTILSGQVSARVVADDEAEGRRSAADAPKITVEVTITGLSDEQEARFGGNIEWLKSRAGDFFTRPTRPVWMPPTSRRRCASPSSAPTIPRRTISSAPPTLRAASTEEDTPEPFSKKDKQHCGFLFLRSLRTGSRALSLEHGSLLDIILRLKEIRPQMWEGTIGTLAEFDVASDPAIGISGVLESIDKSLKKYVPREWGVKPHLKVSNLTREHLRKVVTAFIATGDGDHAAPFYRQGTGTINMLVLAMLSQIAEDKQNVIFAMEEVETAIPPYAQKRIVHELRKLAAQSIFTSHSPYVLEEFSLDETVILSRSNDGVLTAGEDRAAGERQAQALPPGVPNAVLRGAAFASRPYRRRGDGGDRLPSRCAPPVRAQSSELRVVGGPWRVHNRRWDRNSDRRPRRPIQEPWQANLCFVR